MLLFNSLSAASRVEVVKHAALLGWEILTGRKCDPE